MQCNGYCTSAEFTHPIRDSGLGAGGATSNGRKQDYLTMCNFDNDDMGERDREGSGSGRRERRYRGARPSKGRGIMTGKAEH